VIQRALIDAAANAKSRPWGGFLSLERFGFAQEEAPVFWTGASG
jgi:hypothetical protein